MENAGCRELQPQSWNPQNHIEVNKAISHGKVKVDPTINYQGILLLRLEAFLTVNNLRRLTGREAILLVDFVLQE